MQKKHFYLRKSILLFVFACICFSFASAQEMPVKIVDSGELLSTYNLKTAEPEKQQIRTQVSENVLQDILNYSQENAWPEGINTLDGRNSNRSSLNAYKAYKVATFGEESRYMVLRIPASMNQFQPANMIPKRDIFFIIGKSGAREMNGMPYNLAETPTIDAEEDADEEEMREVSIIDTRELYATYDLRNDNAAKALLIESGELTEEEYGVLAEMVKEQSWPEAINSYENREENRPKIRDYVAYMALDYESEGKKLMMLYIPANENKFMPQNMQPKNEIGFYMVFNKKGVEYVNNEEDAPVPIKRVEKENVSDFQPSVSRTSAYNFSDQLNVLVEGLHNNFEDLKGAEIKEDFFLGNKYASLLNLTGAENSGIYEAALSDEVEGASVISDFGDYRDLEEGVNAYKALVAKVSETKFPCCKLVQNEQENETLRTTYWLPFDIGGKMHPSMNKMVIEVQLMKTLGIDSKTFTTYDNYSLVLRIYKQK